MTDGQLAAALYLPLGSYILHALWRVIRSGSGPALAAVGAGYLIMAILGKAALPSLENVALWLPLLYPYAWMGVSALLWAMARVGPGQQDFRGRHAELAIYFHSQLALHLGTLLLSVLMPWQPCWLYLFFPPLVAGIGYLWYRIMLWSNRQSGQDVFIRRAAVVLAWLIPLSVLAVTTRLAPLLLVLS